MPGPYFGSGLGALSPDGRWLAVPLFGQASHGYVMILDTRTGERVGEGVDAWNAPTGGVIKLGTEPVQALAALDVRLDDRPAVDHGPRRGASGAGIRR